MARTAERSKLTQALAERLGGDPPEAVHQVGEPLGAGAEIADHQQAPPLADAFHGACRQAEVVVGPNIPGHWALTITGIVAIPAATCVAAYGGAAVVLGGWFTASAVIAAHGGYHAQLGHQVPWLPIVVVGFLGVLLMLRRIPAVARALAAPRMTSRLELPHSFRVPDVRRLRGRKVRTIGDNSKKSVTICP